MNLMRMAQIKCSRRFRVGCAESETKRASDQFASHSSKERERCVAHDQVHSDTQEQQCRPVMMEREREKTCVQVQAHAMTIITV
eukprot:2920094-Rhodomonas_salina.4